MRKILTGLCVIFVLSVAPLAHSDSVDPKQFGQFGQCAVVTQVDDFTDAKSPLLFCKGEGDSLGSYGVSVTCRQGKFGTAFLAGIQFHMDETIDVLYRFDKGELTTNTWRYSENAALNVDKAVHHRFLEDIEKAKKLVFKVGDEAGAVDLTGTSGVVTEYKKRCAALGRPIK